MIRIKLPGHTEAIQQLFSVVAVQGAGRPDYSNILKPSGSKEIWKCMIIAHSAISQQILK